MDYTATIQLSAPDTKAIFTHTIRSIPSLKGPVPEKFIDQKKHK